MARKRVPMGRPTKVRRSPVVTIKPHGEVWAKALELAGDDRARLRTNPDGSITVYNQPVR